jgi:hypothetical protein
MFDDKIVTTEYKHIPYGYILLWNEDSGWHFEPVGMGDEDDGEID